MEGGLDLSPNEIKDTERAFLTLLQDSQQRMSGCKN
jgi:hypothetical protein